MIASGSGTTGLTSQLESLNFKVHSCPEQNLRGSRPIDLFRDGTVSAGGFLSLLYGRCNDFMLPSGGAVGCYLSHVKACELVARHGQHDVCLVVEEDCVLDLSLMKSALAAWEAMLPDPIPEVIFFGGKPLRSRSPIDAHATPNDSLLMLGEAELVPALPGSLISRTHCVLYSPAGAKKVAAALSGKCIEVQVDSMFSALVSRSGTDALRLWWCAEGASQKLHVSSVQDVCVPCLLRGAGLVVAGVLVIIVAFLVGALLGSRHSPAAAPVR